MLFFRSFKLLCLILFFLACNPSAGYHPVKRSQEDIKSSDSVNSRRDNGKESNSEDSSSTNDRTRKDKKSGKNPSEQEEDEGDAQDKNIKLPTINYKAPTPYIYPDDYNGARNTGSIPQRHLLVWHETPSSEVLINWGLDTFEPNAEHMVFLSETQYNGIDPENNYELKFTAAESGLAETCGNQVHSNLQVKVTGLKPNTTYYYITRSNGQRSKEMHFVTAPLSNGVSFKLLSGGDSRSDSDQRVVMNEVMASMTDADPNYIALVHGGDFIADGDNCNQWLSWRDDHQSTIPENGRIMPLLATFGNHEEGGEEQYQQLFGDPLALGTFYFLSTIGNLSLIVLNSQVSTEGDQQNWLQSTLQSLKNKENHLIVAGYHRPAWPANKSPGSTTSWIDEFQDFQVNLVLESDGHTLKQTCPIFNDICDPNNGIIYVGEGGLGVSQREAVNADEWYFDEDFGGYALSEYHVQSLSVTSTGTEPSKLTYEVYYNNRYNHKIELMSKDRALLGNN